MTPEQQATIAEIERLADDLGRFIARIGANSEIEASLFKLREAVLWAVKGVEEL